MNFEASGTLNPGAKTQYFCMLDHGEVLRQFDALSSESEGASLVNLAYIILVLSTQFFLLMRCPIKSARCAAE